MLCGTKRSLVTSHLSEVGRRVFSVTALPPCKGTVSCPSHHSALKLRNPEPSCPPSVFYTGDSGNLLAKNLTTHWGSSNYSGPHTLHNATMSSSYTAFRRTRSFCLCHSLFLSLQDASGYQLNIGLMFGEHFQMPSYLALPSWGPFCDCLCTGTLWTKVRIQIENIYPY